MVQNKHRILLKGSCDIIWMGHGIRECKLKKVVVTNVEYDGLVMTFHDGMKRNR